MSIDKPRRPRMPGWLYLFLAVLGRRPHQACAIAFWYITRRRLRAHNKLRAAANNLLPTYKTWIRIVERESVAALIRRTDNKSDIDVVKFSFFIDTLQWSSSDAVDKTITSVLKQTSQNFEIILAVYDPDINTRIIEPRVTYLQMDDRNASAALNSALRFLSGAFIIIVPPDAILPSWALARYQDGAILHPEAGIFYGDEDCLDHRNQRTTPWFKPSWNSEMLLAQDYVSGACAIATRLACAAPRIDADLAGCASYALLLAVARHDVPVVHIPYVLCHNIEGRIYNHATIRMRAVSRHISRVQATAEVGPFATVRVRWPLAHPVPPVTIIIPTRDRVDLLEACVGSLLAHTQYSDFDVLIIDNGSADPATHAWFKEKVKDHRVSVISYDRPYNYSAINNFAAARSRGRYLCLLNNDTEIVEGNWLQELMRYAARPEVGAVGAKLLYPDRSIQHAGVVIGLGGAAGHGHRALPDTEFGYFAQAHVPRYASAVTAACLLVAQEKFAAVGGFDEVDLQIAYNDVDLCLKLEQAGWCNVYAPQAVLIHHESKSRGLDLSPQHLARYSRELSVLRVRWDTANFIDRNHHPMLDRSSEIYRVQL